MALMAQRARTRIPAEMVQLVAGGRQLRPPNHLAVPGRPLVAVDHGHRVTLHAGRIERRHIGQPLRRRRHRHRRRPIKGGIRGRGHRTSEHRAMGQAGFYARPEKPSKRTQPAPRAPGAPRRTRESRSHRTSRRLGRPPTTLALGMEAVAQRGEIDCARTRGTVRSNCAVVGRLVPLKSPVRPIRPLLARDQLTARFSDWFVRQPRRRAEASRKAADGSRTRDLELGKLALYQLSYRRMTIRLAAVV